jgi:hypothetical protein
MMLISVAVVRVIGVRIGVLLPLKDNSHRTIGALRLMYPYQSGQKEQDFLQRSEVIRDQLAKKIPSVATLFEHK